MKNKDMIKELSEEVKKKLAACKTKEEVRKVLAEAGVEPLDEKDLDKVAGGMETEVIKMPHEIIMKCH